MSQVVTDFSPSTACDSPEEHVAPAGPAQPEGSHSAKNPTVAVGGIPVAAVAPASPPRRKARELYLRKYTACALFASLGGFLFGFDTGSIGPITVMVQFLDLYPISTTMQGFVVSSILLTGATASLFAGSLLDRISRIYTFSVGGTFFAIGSALAASSTTLGQLLTGRLIAGVGEGLFMSGIIVYQCEIAPTAIRGTLACTLQLFVVIGIATGFFICYGTVNLAGSFSWRIPFIIQALVAAVFAAGSPFLIHSPRWLTHVGRHEEAMRAWARLGLTGTEAEKEEQVVEQQERTNAVLKQVTWKQMLKMLWAKDVRMRTFLGCFLMGMQQLSGIDGVLYYAPTLFSQAGLSSGEASFLASGVSGLLNVGCTILTQPFQDKWGRRPTVIIGGSAIALCMLTIGAIYASEARNTHAGQWAVIVLIYCFIGAFCMSWAITNRTYASEIQPMKTRAAATSMGQAANWITNWVVAFSMPTFLERSGSGPYFLFGACTLLTVLVCAAYLPETKGVSLEDLDEVFKTTPWKKMSNKMAQKRSAHQQRTHSGDSEERFEDIEMTVSNQPCKGYIRPPPSPSFEV